MLFKLPSDDVIEKDRPILFEAATLMPQGNQTLLVGPMLFAGEPNFRKVDMPVEAVVWAYEKSTQKALSLTPETIPLIMKAYIEDQDKGMQDHFAFRPGG